MTICVGSSQDVPGNGEVASLTINGVQATKSWGAMFEVSRMPASPYTIHATLADGSLVRLPCPLRTPELSSITIPSPCWAGVLAT